MQSQILYLLRDLNNQISPKFERCTGISQSRLALLSYLYKHGEISQTILQKEINIDSAAITRHVKQLEAAGKVSRRKSTDDNRVTLVRLTDIGYEEVVSYKNERDSFVASMLKDFNEEELQILFYMLKRMQQNTSEIEEKS